ncbi:MAG: hypothetical protein WBC44_22435, partial [Planctomycetaceae bacterium]
MSEGFWWAALAIAGASAAAHLFSMLGTRWGDRRASFKALLFSLLLHLSLFFGLFAVGPKLEQLGRSPDRSPQPEPEPIAIREIVSETGETELADATGDAPLWDRPSERPAEPADRSERPVELPAALEESRTVVESPEAPDTPIPSPAILPEMPEASPMVVESATPQLSAESRPLEIEEETAESRVEERLPL